MGERPEADCDRGLTSPCLLVQPTQAVGIQRCVFGIRECVFGIWVCVLGIGGVYFVFGLTSSCATSPLILLLVISDPAFHTSVD